MNKKRVVVTGMGCISPVGLDIPTMWQNLVAGRSGIRPITLFDANRLEVHIAGEAHGFDPLNYMTAKDARRADRFTQFAIAALGQALAQSGLEINEDNAGDIGVIIGSAAGGILTYSHEFEVLHEKGPGRVSPLLIPMITVDSASVQVALSTGARGPNHGVASACATGADAIGQAYETILLGHAQAMVTGGVEAAVTLIGMASFDRMRALSRRNDDPSGASRPFDGDRDGFVVAEGGAVLILEELDFALKRGAEPLAEIIGYAANCDAFHITAPDAKGTGAAECMASVLKRAGLAPTDVSYINAHGTGTPAGDPSETVSIKRVFGPQAAHIPVSSTKSMTGHLLGGAGALEAAVCVQALRTGLIPPTINLHSPDPSCDLDYVPNQARRADVRVALSNSFGFGGHNATLAVRAFRLPG
jgi:beta-ketoacyl-acyl-carrier-protein synthase II